MDEERRGKGRKNDFAANCSERRGQRGKGQRATAGGGKVSEGGVGGIKFRIDASQIYRGEDILSVLALSPIHSSGSFWAVKADLSVAPVGRASP